MRHQKSHRANDIDRKSENLHEDQGKEGIKFLAKMIARVYLDEVACQRRIARGAKPRMYVETIHIKVSGKDINEQKEQRQLHVFLDEVLDLMTLKLIGGNKSPRVFEKNGFAIKIKV